MTGLEILQAIRKKARDLKGCETAWVPFDRTSVQEELDDLGKLGFARWGWGPASIQCARLTEEGLIYLRTHT